MHGSLRTGAAKGSHPQAGNPLCLPRKYNRGMARAFIAAVGLLALVGLPTLQRAIGPDHAVPTNAVAQTVVRGECPSQTRMMLRLGIGDVEETDWSGTASGWVVGGSSWKIDSSASPTKLAGGQRAHRILPAVVELALPSVACGSELDLDSKIRIDSAQGAFEFAPLRVRLGNPVQALGGRVEIARVPAGTPIASADTEEDFPDCAVLGDRSVVCTYVEYAPGRPVDEAAALAGDFDSIEFEGNGDRIVLIRREGAGWGDPIYATPSGRDIWRPAVMALPGGGATVLWSEQRNGNWDIFARRYSPVDGTLGAEMRITSDPGSDINVVASDGYFAWQGRRGKGFDIFASRLEGEPVRVSSSDANDWRPSIATDSKGGAWIAWDTYDAGNYDVLLRRFDGEEVEEPIAVAESPRFEARPSVAVDARDRVWIAFEDSDEGWGKDAGDRWTGKQAAPLYVTKNVLVRVWDGSLRRTVTPPKAATLDSVHDDPRVATSQKHRISIPRIALDKVGRPWVFFRKHPLQTGSGERWRSYAAYFASGEWSAPIPLRESDHLLDRYPGLAVMPDGSVLAVCAGDKRKANVRDREDSDLFEALLVAEGDQSDIRLVPVDPAEPSRVQDPVHPDETDQIARIRSERVRVGGRELHILRGEFHRHTEFSAHRDWDGPFEEVWRYGLDVADLDWIGPGDHDYAVGQDYMWWLQQKASDMYHDPGRFSAMYTYERNVGYPSGHRNVMLPRRGIRPLPRMQGRNLVFGTEEEGSPDIKNLFAYLRHFGAICSSHTSATNMGTDWRDWDSEVEPVVELFQGHRQSYELAGGPRAATGPEDTIQGYRPLGFVWEAFKKGRRLGFQASSDHVSTHISYGMVLAEENSRDGIMEAFKQRHSYAAHDNIVLLVTSGNHLMGDEFNSSSVPRLRIVAKGTASIDKVDIIRQVGLEQPTVVASMEPRRGEVDLDWSDPAAVVGEWNMYYVRLEQRNAAMAWASPIWIQYQP